MSLFERRQGTLLSAPAVAKLQNGRDFLHGPASREIKLNDALVLSALVLSTGLFLSLPFHFDLWNFI